MFTFLLTAQILFCFRLDIWAVFGAISKRFTLICSVVKCVNKFWGPNWVSKWHKWNLNISKCKSVKHETNVVLGYSSTWWTHLQSNQLSQVHPNTWRNTLSISFNSLDVCLKEKETNREREHKRLACVIRCQKKESGMWWRETL